MTIKQQGGIFGRNPTFNSITTNSAIFEDNSRAKFGNSSDLQIYHDGSNSYVSEAGAGALRLQGTNLQLQSSAGENYLQGINNNRVDIYYDGAIKLTTTSTGVSITGNVAVPAGNGIDFSATSGTGTSELFSDYEEGSWSPDPQDSSGNSGSAGTASGYYTKIGNVVFATVLLENIDTTGLTAGQDFRIYGLPYTSASLAGSQIFTGDARMNSVTFSGNPNLAILDSTDYIRIVESISGSASDFVVVSEIASGTADIYGTITYMAA